MANNYDNNSDLDLLNTLLGNTEEEEDQTEENTKTNESLKELSFDFLSSETNIRESSEPKKSVNSLKIDDLYSSDEEYQDYFDKKHYSEYGQGVKQLLKNKELGLKEPKQSYPKALTVSSNILKKANLSTSTDTTSSTTISESKNIYCDPIFNIAINKPLISSAELVQLMNGRKPVKISKLKDFLSVGKPSEDWVVAGVITHKSSSKKSSKGDNYAIWKLSDMTMNMNTISVFMFRNAYKTLWKVMEGSVIGILNPNVMESRDNNDLAPLCVDNPAKVLILGTSRDMGYCKSKKKNGDQCTSIVNSRHCEYCVYHVKQEYSKHSRRSDLQSNFNGKGMTMSGEKNPVKKSINKFLNMDMNFATIPSKKSTAMCLKDKDRLQKLQSNILEQPAKQIINSKLKPTIVDISQNQNKKDLTRLNKLKSFLDNPIEVKEDKPVTVVKPQPSSEVLSKSQTALSFAISAPKTASRFDFSKLKSSSTATSTSLIIDSKKSQKPKISNMQKLMTPKTSQKFDLNSLSGNCMVPKLGSGVVNGVIDLSSPISRRGTDMAKQKALQYIQQNGGLKPSNPNHILKSKELQAKYSAKRKRNEIEEERENETNNDTFMEKFQKLMETKSSHTDLIKKAENAEEDKYFNKMELKERMEDKMLTTFQVPCKAVHCPVCKYTAFSSSDMCKEERHPIKVLDAVKRFYKCGDCGNRTVTLSRIPTSSCSKCNSSNWLKTAMMDEKRTKIKPAHLSIRGDEETFYGCINNANINLIIPDPE